jgi:hypothetical protein
MHNTVPTLDKHEFVQQPLIRTPFINSAFQTRLGLLSTSGFNIPLPDFLPDSIRAVTGELLYVNLGFAYNQKIKDWIGLYATIEINVRSGTELSSILTEGLNTLTGGKVGVIFQVLKTKRHQLSGKFEVNNYDANIIDIGQFVKDIINGEPDPSITKDAPALSVGLGASYALAINRLIGVVANADLLYGENIVRGDDAFRMSLAGACDLNFKHLGVPLGLSVGYQLTSAPEVVYVEDKFASTFAVKLAYTAAPNFQLGVEFNSSGIPISSSDEKARAVGAMININYWFN